MLLFFQIGGFQALHHGRASRPLCRHGLCRGREGRHRGDERQRGAGLMVGHHQRRGPDQHRGRYQLTHFHTFNQGESGLHWALKIF